MADSIEELARLLDPWCFWPDREGHDSTPDDLPGSDRRAAARAKAEEILASPVIARIRAEAWDEGHETPWRRDPDDGCHCGGWSSMECACGLYGTGKLLSLDDNPHRCVGDD